MTTTNKLASATRSLIDVQILAVGGTGIDILRDFRAGNTQRVDEGMEHTSITFVDTSDSNIDQIPADMLYRFPGLNGGGKNRKFIVEKTSPHIAPFFDKHKPKKITIVVFGAGGASGAAVGPLMIAELMKRGHNVISMVVGSGTGSTTEIGNTIGTIQTLSNYTKMFKMPLAMFYRQNDSENPIGVVNNAIRSALYAFCGLFSNLNHGIEETDLRNFLDYTKTLQGASIAPALMNLDFFSGALEPLPEHIQVISQATLTAPKKDLDSEFDEAIPGVIYRTTGTMNTVLSLPIEDNLPINFLLMRGDMASRLDTLNNQLNNMQQLIAQAAESIRDIAHTEGDVDGFSF